MAKSYCGDLKSSRERLETLRVMAWEAAVRWPEGVGFSALTEPGGVRIF